MCVAAKILEILQVFLGSPLNFDTEKWYDMYIEQFLKNDAVIFCHNSMTTTLNLVIEKTNYYIKHQMASLENCFSCNAPQEPVTNSNIWFCKHLVFVCMNLLLVSLSQSQSWAKS